MPIKTILKYLFSWQLGVIVITLVAPYFLPLQVQYLGGATQGYLTNPVLQSRANFDGNHYLGIAKNGYGYAQQAFFPLYPNLIRFISKYIPAITSGVLISLVCFSIAIVCLVKLMQLDNHGADEIKFMFVALLLFPVSFYFGSVYTESLFLMLVVLSFYCARKDRWWMAGLLGALATYTRFIGIALLPALLVEFWLQGKKIKHVFPLFLIPLGLLAYMWFLDKTSGDPLAFIHVQKLFGQGRSDKVILLYQVFWRYVKMIATVDIKNPIYPAIILEFISGIAFLWASVVVAFRQRKSYAVFAVISYVVPTFTGNLVSLPRYILTAFPFFIGYGCFLAKYDKLRLPILFISGCLLTVFTVLFVRGYWVA